MTLYTIPTLGQYLIKFKSLYAGEGLISSPDEKMILKPKSERVCRFCGKGISETTFDHDAHTIPNCLGNEYHVSDSECDCCNNKLSDLDDQLKHFFGVVPLMTGTKGRKGIKSYTSHKEGLVAGKSKRPLLEGDIEISIQDFEDHSIEFDKETGECTLNYTKKKYIPFKVYKALLKIAISSLPDGEVKNYQRLIKTLINDDDSQLARFAMVVQTRISILNGYNYPIGFLFKKCVPNSDFQTHCFILCYQNEILQIALPWHPQDENIYENNRASLCICPPLFFEDLGEIQFTPPQLIMLSSIEPKADDKQQIHMVFKKEELNNTIVLTPNGEWYESSSQKPEKLKGFVRRRSSKPGIPLDPNKKIDPPL